MENTDFEFSHTRESRSFCPTCDFLRSRCLCETLKLIPNNVHLVILQHPSESKHPLNTVRIMKKSFKKMTVFIGEDFTNHQGLNEILNHTECLPALLYPGANSLILENLSNQQRPTHLLLLDGTWRKAKKIYLSSKNLHNIRTYTFMDVAESEYRIRKSSVLNSLSTLEASTTALAILEPGLETSAAKKSFQKMIDFQIKKMGRDIYQKNYLSKKNEQ